MASTSTAPPAQGSMGSVLKFPRRRGVSNGEERPSNASRPVVPKSDATLKNLHTALESNVLFSHLDKEQRLQLFDAMFVVEAAAGETIIKQGDVGDNFYILDSGSAEILIGTDVVVPKVEPGGSFGELALMYGSPRAATVRALEPCKMWALERADFREILMATTIQRRALYDSFLQRLPLLSELTESERLIVADALRTVEFPSGHTVIKQGERGEDFFIIVEGEADVWVTSEGGERKSGGHLGPSDYFGEIALLSDRPRAASVVSTTPLKCVTLDVGAFIRVLGPCEDILRRNMEKYRTYVGQDRGGTMPESGGTGDSGDSGDAGDATAATE